MGNSTVIEQDSLYQKAKEFALEDKMITRESLQSLLRIGYPRSVRIMEALADEGLVDYKSRTKNIPREEVSDDELSESIRAIFTKEGRISLTILQRRLGVGYSRLEELVKKL